MDEYVPWTVEARQRFLNNWVTNLQVPQDSAPLQSSTILEEWKAGDESVKCIGNSLNT